MLSDRCSECQQVHIKPCVCAVLTSLGRYSLERLDEYIQIEQEPKGGDAPPAHWPTSGDLQVEGLCAAYVADGPKVLQNITFSMKSGERIGIGERGMQSV